jgi:hypothetical protein
MMTPIAGQLMHRVYQTLGADESLADVQADCYWQHLEQARPRQSQLFLVLAIPNPMIGQPPIIGTVPIPLPLAGQATISGVVRGSVSTLRAEARKMLS